MDKVLKKELFSEFLALLARDYDLYGPSFGSGGTADYSYPTFGRIDRSHPLVLEYTMTMVSLKNMFFPDNQTLYTFEKSDGDVILDDPEEGWDPPRAFVGVHTCDIVALARLDRVLLGDRYVDERYKQKRASSLIVGLTCGSCRSSCFCNSTSSGPDVTEGFDLLLTDIGDGYYVRSGSLTGDRLLATELFQEPGAEAVRERERRLAEVEDMLPAPLDTAVIARMIQDENVSAILQTFADHCFTCGACNLVCPTCHCFTFTDRSNSLNTRGSRHLIWDACHYAKFAAMAGNANVRSEKKTRFRHRIFDKYGYDYRRYGSTFCIGCGRCLEFCPGHINMYEAAKAIEESER